ncbi:MAG TPA: hypothetical protein VM328_00840 [Fimbriimonadaceae bacterium]|nr:hypothetical protein [Fimbriimonadaceae bacterium]
MSNRAALFVALLLAVAGCSGGTNVVGKYKAQLNVAAGKENDPAAAFAKGMAESMTLELKEDKTFTMTAMMFPVEGTYTVSGSTVTLNPTKIMGMDMSELAKKDPNLKKENEQMLLRIEDGGKTLVGVDDKQSGSGTAEIKFVRE